MSGKDDCIEGAMCWDVSAENVGVCGGRELEGVPGDVSPDLGAGLPRGPGDGGLLAEVFGALLRGGGDGLGDALEGQAAEREEFVDLAVAVAVAELEQVGGGLVDHHRVQLAAQGGELAGVGGVGEAGPERRIVDLAADQRGQDLVLGAPGGALLHAPLLAGVEGVAVGELGTGVGGDALGVLAALGGHDSWR